MKFSQVEPRHLELVRTIAETGSLSAAAKRLFVTQSAVSHQLRDVEERAGQRLFIRGRAIRMTAAGSMLLARAAPLLRELARFQAQGDAPPRRLRISTGCYTSYHWLPEAVRRLGVEFPDVEVQLVLEATRAPVAFLDAGKLDIAITTDAPQQKRFARRALFEDELLAVVAPHHPLARGKRVTPEQLGRECILVYDAPLAELDVWTRFLRPARVRPRALHRVPLTEAIVHLARANMGVGVLSSWIAAPYEAQGGLVTLRLGRRLKRTWYAVSLAPGHALMNSLAGWIASDPPLGRSPALTTNDDMVP